MLTGITMLAAWVLQALKNHVRLLVLPPDCSTEVLSLSLRLSSFQGSMVGQEFIHLVHPHQ